MINPLNICSNIKEEYLLYLLSSFPIKHKEIRNIFKKKIMDSVDQPFFNGPILTTTPSYQKGQSLKDLSKNNIVHAKMLVKAFSPERSLYSHQEESILKLSKKNNVVLATGTGSGKTESFLFPIIDHLIREIENKTHHNEVYALILYPMNALVNDQLKRIREYLADFPEITFGRYIGETESKYRDALAKHRDRYNQDPLLNELISRDQMKETPPNILITNYSMLEFLLLRPNDSNLFNGNSWKYIVLDEAHIYDGAVGQECSLLIKRLKDRVFRKHTQFQCIATSATIGQGELDRSRVSRFATDLFGEEFRDDNVIYPSFDIQPQVKRNDLKTLNYENLLRKVSEIKDQKTRALQLYSELKNDQNIYQISDLLKRTEGYVHYDLISKELNIPVDQLNNLLDLASQAFGNKNERLLPVKFHFFIRAMEGLYLFYSKDELDVFFLPTKIYKEHKVFELGICGDCGRLYLLGRMYDNEMGRTYLLPLKMSKEIDDNLDEDSEKDQYFGIVDPNFYHESSIDDLFETDEDVEGTEDKCEDEEQLSTYVLCTKCGELSENSGKLESKCSCQENILIQLKPAKKKNECMFCGARKAKLSMRQVSPFSTGKFAPTNVIARTFYNNLPVNIQVSEKVKAIGQFTVQPKKDLSGARKLLAFSDNRQEAAIFAADVQIQASKLFLMGYIYKYYVNNFQDRSVHIAKLYELILETIQHDNLPLQPEDVSRFMLQQLTTSKKKNTYEHIGLLAIKYIYSISEDLINQISDLLVINRSEVEDLLNIVLDFFRYRDAISFTLNKEMFLKYYEFSPFGFENKSWPRIVIEPQGKKDPETKYLFKDCQDPSKWEKGKPGVSPIENFFFKKLLKDIPISKSRELLKSIYQVLEQVAEIIDSNGQIPIHKISIYSPKEWYQCNHCGSITSRNVKSICVKKNCQGTLIPVKDMDYINRENQFYMIAKNAIKEDIPFLTAQEHTAQLSADNASITQQSFLEGKVNLLSSSTTFEMGVDLGDLNAIFLRNIPPTPANYIQRSGRAGRSANSAPLIVSYCQRRSHDLNYFKNPKDMITGTVKVPQVNMSNNKINIRHVHAIALSDFFRFKIHSFFANLKLATVENFYNSKYYDLFKEFLEEHPESISSSIKYIFSGLDLSIFREKSLGWEWAAQLCSPQLGGISLANAFDLYLQQISEYTKLRDDAKQENKLWQANNYNFVLNHFNQESLLSFIVNNGVLPRYGFPTDVVKVHMEHGFYDKKSDPVELSRDLRVAISEYAPGNEVVADKEIYTISGIKVLPDKQAPKIKYAVCKKCHRYYDETSNPPASCCDTTLNYAFFITPYYGFVCHKKPESFKGGTPEKKSYVNIVNFSGPFEMIFEPIHALFEHHQAQNGTIVYINTNKQKGFLFDEKGRLEIKKTGQTHHLGYKFSTDILAIRPSFPVHEMVLKATAPYLDIIEELDASDVFWNSVMYSIISAAYRYLSISDRDVDGLLTHIDFKPTMIIYDTLSGGAGFSRRIQQNFSAILVHAINQLETCKCDIHTSCYSCLKGYLNQRHHDKLIRGVALDFLKSIVNNKPQNQVELIDL